MLSLDLQIIRRLLVLQLIDSVNSENQLYLSEHHLLAHLVSKHGAVPSTRHINNQQLVSSIYRHTDASVWANTLHWLNNLEPSLPPYRTSLWRKQDHDAKQPYFAALHHLHNLILKSTATLNDDAAPPWQGSSRGRRKQVEQSQINVSGIDDLNLREYCRRQ